MRDKKMNCACLGHMEEREAGEVFEAIKNKKAGEYPA
jgi:hypothetical protein